MMFIYGEVRKCARRAAILFNQRYIHIIIYVIDNVLDFATKFSETGSVKNKKSNNRRRVLNEATQIEILGTFAAESTSSLRIVARQTGISHETIRKDDFDRRIEFCETVSNLVIAIPNLLFNICFTDECTFFLRRRLLL
ncbi:hypothetical protein NQ315_011260 [Exocentrus adspersus]|uniref:Uncharacterized protein n=1 Tax=Exocentrus adspersus TaxID=1586481 RepID=A0AAV8V4Z7_9CUCU|nr:hypothetical protein NQ315_011260 [Exocentrus adspersus]